MLNTLLPLLEKCCWQRWAPYVKPIRPSRFAMCFGPFVDQIAVSIVFHHEAARIPPIVKDLTTQHMPANAPDQFVTFLSQPLMAQALNVKVVHLIAGMMYMESWALEEEKAVVINLFLAPIKMQEGRIVCTGLGIKYDV